MKILRILSVLLLALVIAGCGGGGGNDAAPTTANVLASIDWAARTRGLKAPSSAQSVVITLKDALPGGDFHFLINRNAAPAAYTQTYTSPGLAKLGTWTMSAMFYGQNDGSGDAVGTAGAVVEIKADGTGLPTVATSGTFKSLSIPAGQTATIGTNQDLTVMAGTADSNGMIVKEVAISPGSIVWKVIEGGDKLTFVDGMAKGIAPGVAKITATVDGILSAAQTVTVVSTATIVITPATVSVQVGASQAFTLNFTNLTDKSVTWSAQQVVEGGSPPNTLVGKVTDTGVFTAPNISGTFKVTATSKYDSFKSATAIVTVLSPVTAISLPTIDMVYEPTSNRLYASIPGRAGAQGNSIAIINPQTAKVEATIPIGSEPGKLALADDGKTLYVYLASTSSIVRFDIPTRTPGSPFKLPTSSNAQQLALFDMAVAPGRPDLLAVSFALDFSYQIVIYKDGAPLNSKFMSNSSDYFALAFGASSTRLYNYYSGTLARLNVSDTGVVLQDTNLIGVGNGNKIKFSEDRLYILGGQIFDPETRKQLGIFSSGGNTSYMNFYPAPSVKKAISIDNLSNVGIYNLTDFTLVTSFELRSLLPDIGSTFFSQYATATYSGGKTVCVRDGYNLYVVNPAPGL